MLAGRTAPLRGGDLWVAVSGNGRGVPVKITRVNAVNVYFHAVGKRADQSQQFKLQHAAFRSRYAPVELADVRQKQLQQEDRSGRKPESLGEPVLAVEPDTDTPLTEPVVEPSVVEPPVVIKGTDDQRPKYSSRAKLTGEQAREIYLLAQGTVDREKREISKTYGVSVSSIYEILAGRSYAWATGDLRVAPTPAIEPEPTTEPIPPQPEEPAMHITTPPTVVETKPESHETPADLASIGSDKQAGSTSQRSVLVHELADAVETLIGYAGSPLPKYVVLDYTGLASLIDRARRSR